MENWACRVEHDALQMLEHELTYPANEIDPKLMIMSSVSDPFIGEDAVALYEAEWP